MDSAQIFTSTEAEPGARTPQNQILVNFRRTVGGDCEALGFLATMERQAIRRGIRTFYSEAEQSHAERVLNHIIELQFGWA